MKRWKKRASTKSWSVMTGASATHKLGFSDDCFALRTFVVDNKHLRPPQWRQAKIARRRVSVILILYGLLRLCTAAFGPTAFYD